MYKLFFLAVLLVSVSSLEIAENVKADEKVKIDFYFESLCPYCNQFIGKSLKVAASTPVQSIAYL